MQNISSKLIINCLNFVSHTYQSRIKYRFWIVQENPPDQIADFNTEKDQWSTRDEEQVDALSEKALILKRGKLKEF